MRTRKHQKPSVTERINTLEVMTRETRLELLQTLVAYDDQISDALWARIQVIMERLSTRAEAVEKVYRGERRTTEDIHRDRIERIRQYQEISDFSKNMRQASVSYAEGNRRTRPEVK